MLKLRSYQQKAFDKIMKDLAEKGLSPTGRIVDKEGHVRRALEKTALFCFRYGTTRAISSTSPKLDLVEMEKRVLSTGDSTSAHVIGDSYFVLYGTSDTMHTTTLTLVRSDYVPPVKDFAKAKTRREQLQSRLSPREVKVKPSGLLSKLVSKT